MSDEENKTGMLDKMKNAVGLGDGEPESNVPAVVEEDESNVPVAPPRDVTPVEAAPAKEKAPAESYECCLGVFVKREVKAWEESGWKPGKDFDCKEHDEHLEVVIYNQAMLSDMAVGKAVRVGEEAYRKLKATNDAKAIAAEADSKELAPVGKDQGE